MDEFPVVDCCHKKEPIGIEDNRDDEMVQKVQTPAHETSMYHGWETEQDIQIPAHGTVTDNDWNMVREGHTVAQETLMNSGRGVDTAHPIVPVIRCWLSVNGGANAATTQRRHSVREGRVRPAVNAEPNDHQDDQVRDIHAPPAIHHGVLRRGLSLVHNAPVTVPCAVSGYFSFISHPLPIAVPGAGVWTG